MQSVEHAPSPQADLEPEWMPEIKPVESPTFDKEKYVRLENSETYKNQFAQGIGLGMQKDAAHERAMDIAEREEKDQQLADQSPESDKVM